MSDDDFGVPVPVPVPVPVSSGLDWADESPTEHAETFEVGDVHLLDIGARKISVIRVVRNFTGMGLADSKKLVESAPVKVAEGLPAEQAQSFHAALVAEGARAKIEAGTVAPPVDASGAPLVTLILTVTGPRKINIIKLVREASGRGLKESKDISESTPATIKSGMTRSKAESFQRQIREVGGDARIE